MVASESQTINVLYACDNAFFEPLLVSLQSLVCNCTNNLCIYVISQGVSDHNKARANDVVATRRIGIIWLEAWDYETAVNGSLYLGGYSASMFSRFCLQSLLPESVSRIIYLDCDTVIMGDLVNLWEYPLRGKTLGAVNDYRSKRYARNLGLHAIPYLNSGVLVVDVDKYRANNCEKRLFEALGRYNGVLEFPDNDLLNIVLQDELAVIPLENNAHSIIFSTKDYKELCFLRSPQDSGSEEEYLRAREHPVVIHYTRCFLVRGRPWQEHCNHPMQNRYDAYRTLVLGSQAPYAPFDASQVSLLRRFGGLLPRSVLIAVARFAHAFAKPTVQRVQRKLRGALDE